jgi:hypothetical protein
MFKKWLAFGLSSEQEYRYRKTCLEVHWASQIKRGSK